MCKKRNFNKLLSVFLSVLMLTSFLQTAVSATGSDGTESAEAVTFTAIDGTAGASSAGGTENFDKLMDGSVDTKWCVTNFSTAYVVIEASQAVSISGYQMTTGDDTARETSRNPEDWTLYGCNDYDTESKKGTWEVIHDVVGDPVLQNANKKAFSFACDKTETPYKYYKLLITKNSGSEKCMQLSEFNFTFCEHVTEVLNTRDADCTNYGFIEKKCSVCGLTYKMITARGGHIWGTQSTTDATCTESGTLSQKCSVCNATQTVNNPDAPALGHNFVDGTCTNCDITELEYIQSPHNYPNGYNKIWTITREGAVKIAITFSSETQTESGCDFIYIYDGEDKQIGKYSGTELAGQTVRVASDVVKIRLTSDSSSTYYGFSLTEIKAFYPCEHSWVTQSTTDATCTQGGTLSQVCSACGDTQVLDDPDAPALGHNFVDGTCTNCGIAELEYIQSPHVYPNYFDKTWTITREGAVKIAITFSSKTQTESLYDFIYIYDGEDTQIGRYSGTQLAGQTIRVSSDVVKIRLTSDSISSYYGFSLTEIKAFYPCEHEHTELLNYAPVTCTEDGYTGDTHCLDCDDIIAVGATIPALGLEHSWVHSNYLKPSCTEGGKELQVCTNCGDEQYVYVESAPALGHNFVNGVCTNCGLTELEYIQSPHSYPDNYDKTWTITREGAEKIAITFSENTRTETAYDYIYIYDGGDTQIGKYSGTELEGRTITVASDVVKIRLTSDGGSTYYGFSLTDISAEYSCGHSDVNIINYTPASCGRDGYSGDVYCNTCDAVVVTGKALAATGHNFITVSTETPHPHTTIKVCTNCGAKNTEKPALDDCFECNFNITEKTDNSFKLLSYLGSDSVVSIPASYEETAITEIGTACFKGNTTITEVVIPDSVTSIGSLAFMGCSNLSKVTIPASVTSIGTQAFYGFTGTIYCEKGSYAYEYAVANNIKYAIIG
ncbi:MAG: leucine-rich repeat protein, partial [Oscillospiraceae bacterium]|nr:leucine-rich repeat protein [Oscillospiraceae bacterium]